MKKYFFIFVLLCLVSGGASAHAAGAGQDCVPNVPGACDFGYTCDPQFKVCIAASSSNVGAVPTTPVPTTNTSNSGSLNQVTLPNPTLPSVQQDLNQSAPAQDTNFVPLAGIPNLTENAQATPQGITAFLNNLYKYLVGLAAVLAVIEIIRGGLEIATKDSVSKQTDGRHRITQAVLGLVLVLSPVLVFSIINPAILSLSLDSLKPLDTQWGNSTAGSSTGGAANPPAPTQAGTYTMGIDSSYLKTATAADQNGADQFFTDKCADLSDQNTSCEGNTQGPNGCTQGTIAWCSKTMTVTAYYWKYACAGNLVGANGYGCVGDHYVGISPSYTSAAQTFQSGCESAGGKFWQSAVDSSTPVVPVACTDTTGFQPYDSTQYSGYSCNFQDQLKCVPAGQ